MSTTTVLTATDIPTDALAAWLGEQTWSSFAQSLATFFAARGYLTERQEASARSMYAKRAQATAAPAEVVVPAKRVSVADGHYALTVEGVVKFYRVNTPTEGKWAGYTFVDAQASDDYHKTGRELAHRILAEIAVDPLAAMKLYGIELGKCGHCGRKLTSEWRKVGIGPICSRKMQG